MTRFALKAALAALALPLAWGDARAESLAGAPPETVAFVSRMDRNGDGRVSRSELDEALRIAEAAAPAAFDAYWAERTAAIAVDNGAVPSREAGRTALRLLDEADVDRDGTVTSREAQDLVSARPPHMRQAALYALAMADIDFDGVVTKDEIEGLRRRSEFQGQPDATTANVEDEETRRARAEARKDFLDGKAQERRLIAEAWDRLSDANNHAPLPELRKELFGIEG